MNNPGAKACGRSIGPDCRHLGAALSLWCTSELCIRARGTSIPGVINCPYYIPVRPPWIVIEYRLMKQRARRFLEWVGFT